MLKKTLLFLLANVLILLAQQRSKQQFNIAKVESKSFSARQALRYPGDSSIDVTYYWLNIKLDYNAREISGFTQIDFKSKKPSLNSFFIDLQDNLILDSVVSGGKKLSAKHSLNVITISPNQPLSYGGKYSVKIYYHGTPGSSGFGSFEFSKHGTSPVIWSLSEPYGASDWFPNKDNPGDKADSSDVWITADSFFVSVSNGTLVGITVNKDGTKTYKWKNRYPISPYLISLAMTNYKEYDVYFKYTNNDSMIVRNFIYPEHFTTRIKSQFSHTVDMLKVYSNLFGLYPFVKEKYGHVEFGWSGGMEHQTITSVGTNYDKPYFSDHLISHELAHQWFGDKITCKDWHNIWLNEGFASYCEALYTESRYGKNAYNQEINYDMSIARGAVGSIWVKDISSVAEIFDYSRSYKKAAVVLHMLRGVLGDSLFFKTLYNYSNDSSLAYNAATTEDFRKVAEKTSGMDLAYFFNEWIYGESFPVYSVNWSFKNETKGFYSVRIIVNQTERKNPLYFAMPIKFKIHTSYGDTLFTLFNNAAPADSFNIRVKGKPDSLIFDYGNWILKILNSVVLSGVKNSGLPPENIYLAQNYPNPFNPATTIEYTIPRKVKKSGNSSDASFRRVVLKIYDLTGKEIRTLVNGRQKPGRYKIKFSAGGLPSGIYFYRLTVGNNSLTKKMILLK